MRFLTIRSRNTPSSYWLRQNNMKAFFKKHLKLHIWLAVDLILLALYFGLRGNRTWMNALTRRFTTPLKHSIGKLCYLTDVSVMEILYGLAAVGVIVYLAWSAVSIIRAKERRDRAYHMILGAVNIGLTVYAVFCLMWGVNFWTDSFQEQSGIYAQSVQKEELAGTTAYFVAQLIRTADAVPRNEDGTFAVPMEEILEDAPTIYDPLEQVFPELEFDDPGVKAMRFSRLMSITGFTGVYFACIGESNVNVDSPTCLLPSTIAHELAHQRGVASEQECNFLGVLASTTSGNVAYEYSGWLLGFVHLGNALYRINPDVYWALRAYLPESVEADLRANNEYWDQFEDNVVEQVSEKVYDGMLKSYGEVQGIQSYGTVVDLLVTYYKNAI